MSFPLPLYIGYRYLGTKRRSHFISFITGTSILGLALSVTVLITVLSVLNGFDQIIQDKIFHMANHITVQDPGSPTFKNWSRVRQLLLKEPHILGAAPFKTGQGLLIQSNQNRPVLVYGIIPQLEKTVSIIPTQLSEGTFKLEAGKYQMIVDEKIAWSLDLSIGSKLYLLAPAMTKTALGIKPRLQEFTIIGIIRNEKSDRAQFYNAIAYIHFKDMQNFYEGAQSLTGLRLRTEHLYRAPRIAQHLLTTPLNRYIITNWTEDYGNLMMAISLEKTIMFCTLSLLIAIAAFNLVSSLMMVVTEKQTDIAILRTLGARSSTILNIFIIQGVIIGLIGTFIGLVGGILLSNQIGSFVALLENVFNIPIISANPLFITNHLPSKIKTYDLIAVSSVAILMSLFATLYPAFRASKTIPTEALRYE